MKKKRIIIAMLLAAVCMVSPSYAEQKLEVTESIYLFEPVPEGVHVSHDFILKNTGDARLIVEKVMPP